MKTTGILLALIICGFMSKAQSNNTQQISTVDKVILQVSQSSTIEYLPVYFNYRRRLLKYNGTQRMDGAEFLNLCRTIRDSAVQEQVARYDAYTAEKQKLGLAALGSGFAGFALLGGAAANTQSNETVTATLAVTGVMAVLAIPAIAIYSSVPHQRRKTVLFRDLPIAYNLFVETQRLRRTN
ncbi:MAG: hypothetical protein V4506_09575 [Bacteroidota bacterium]